MNRLLLICLLSFATLLTTHEAAAASVKGTTAAPAQGKKARALPFHGNIGLVDKQAQTIKVGKRVFQVTSETRVQKNGKTATLNDAAPGDEVGGSYRDVGGKLTLVSLRIGPKPDGK